MRVTGRPLAARLGTLVFPVLALALLIPPGAGAQPRLEPALAPVSSGVDTFASCMAAQRSADVIFLLDESRSLQTSDKAASRVTAARYLIRQWAELSRKGISLSVAVSGFASTYDSVQPWTPLTAAGVSQVDRALQQLVTRNTGLQTDYWMALDGARRALSERARGKAHPCQAIVWLSDGKMYAEATYKLENGQTVVKPYVGSRGSLAASKATELASNDICRPGGVADQLRTSRVGLFGIGLQGAGSPKSDFQLMQRVATGISAGNTCGRFVHPTPGDFRLVSDIDPLLFAFDRLRSLGQVPNEQNLGVCQGAICRADQHRFVLDGSIRSVHVLASSDLKSGDVYLVVPGRPPMLMQRGGELATQRAAIGGVGLQWSWLTKKSLSVDLVAGSGARPWTGVWSVVFVDRSSSTPKARSRSAVQLSADILPAWQAPHPASLHAGEKSALVSLGLTNSKGARIDPRALLGTMSVDASVVDATGASIPIATGLTKLSLGTPLALDLRRAKEGAGVLRLVLRLTTASAEVARGEVVRGTVLAPQQVDLPLKVLPPLGFPVVADRVDFGRAQGAGELRGGLAVKGPGCVWLGTGDVRIDAAPVDAGPLAVLADKGTSPQGCLAVAKGATSTLPLRLTTKVAANGTVNGALTVHIAPKGEIARARTVLVPFTADLQRPVDVARKVWMFALMLFLGLGIPVGLLYAAKWRAARIPAQALLAQSIPVTVEDDQVRRDGATFALRSDDLRELVPVPPGGARRLTLGAAELAVRTGRSPFGAGDVTVTIPGQVAVSSEDGQPRPKTGSTSLPLAVHNHWVLSHDPAGATTAATVLLLVGGDADIRTRQRIVDDLNDRAPALLRRIRSSVPGLPTEPTRSPRGDGGAIPSNGWNLSDPDLPGVASVGVATQVWGAAAPPAVDPGAPSPGTAGQNGQNGAGGQHSSNPLDFRGWSLDDPDRDQ